MVDVQYSQPVARRPTLPLDLPSRSPAFLAYLWLRPRRTWFELLQPTTSRLLPSLRREDGDAGSAAAPEVGAIDVLGRDSLLEVFKRLPIRDVVRCSAVCREWRALVDGAEEVWRAACLAVPAWRAPGDGGAAHVIATVDRFFNRRWRDMYTYRPHLRTDGLYVSRNTYLRRGEVYLKARAPVHLVVYFRYYAFSPAGGFLYRCTPSKPASQRVLARPRAALRCEGVYSGELAVRDTAVHTVVTYAAGAVSHVHTWLRLRSTALGANDRLDVRSMVQLEDGQPQPPEPSMEYDASEDYSGRGWHAAEGGMGDWGVDGSVRPLSRGLSRFAFIPWDGLDEHVLNADVEELDFYHAG